MPSSHRVSLDQYYGLVVYKAQKKLFKIFPEYVILDPMGSEIANVKRLFAFRPKFRVLAQDKLLQVEGNFIGHSFTISENGRSIVSITKKLFSFGDSYVIDVQDDYNNELYLFITVIIDQIIEEAEAKRRNAGD